MSEENAREPVRDLNANPILVRNHYNGFAYFPIYLNGYGIFYADTVNKEEEGDAVAEGRVSAKTLDEVIAKLNNLAKAQERQKKIKVRIPFTFIAHTHEGSVLRKGFATGIHAATNNVLIEWDDGKKEQVKSYESSGYLFNATSEQEAELASLLDTIAKSRKRLSEITQPLMQRGALRDRVKAEIAKVEENQALQRHGFLEKEKS